MSSKKCKSCGKGTYMESSIMDDINGVLHCTHCKVQVKRWQEKENRNESK